MRLELSASANLSLTLPFTVQFVIKRVHDLTSKPVMFEWSPHIHGFMESGLVLLHHTATKLEVIPVDHSDVVDISRKKPLMVNGYNHDLWELAPGGFIKGQVDLPARFQKSLKPGEKYTLLWPGGATATWEYGTLREHMGQEIKDKDRPLVLPGGYYVSFTAHDEFQPWPMRAEREAQVGFHMANIEEQKWRYTLGQPKDTFPPRNHIDYDPDAPQLRVVLECSSTFLRHDSNARFEVSVKVIYEAERFGRPITFRTRPFEDNYNYQLGRRCNGTWKNFEHPGKSITGFMLVDDPDVPVTVGQDDRFVDLQPGETWMTKQYIGDDSEELPDDAGNGESFCYIFTGTTLDWWDWGSKTHHEGTVVMLPCFLWGPVVNPRDNNGRPKLSVPESNVVEFTLVE